MSLVAGGGGIAVYVWGRDRVVAVSGAVTDERIDAIKSRLTHLEATQVDEHLLRRDVNRDVGQLDKRLTAAEVHVGDHGRRLDRLETREH